MKSHLFIFPAPLWVSVTEVRLTRVSLTEIAHCQCPSQEIQLIRRDSDSAHQAHHSTPINLKGFGRRTASDQALAGGRTGPRRRAHPARTGHIQLSESPARGPPAAPQAAAGPRLVVTNLKSSSTVAVTRRGRHSTWQSR